MSSYCNTFLLLLLLFGFSPNQTNAQNLAIVKYKGGGDWYSNPTALPNLINYCNANIKTKMNAKPQVVDIGSIDILSEFSNKVKSTNFAFSIGIDILKNSFSIKNKYVKEMRNNVIKYFGNKKSIKNITQLKIIN